ncbi:very short patch repair endonuclease [Collimonas antrihumi]|uniref:very short patch repair endonuclease n=1 Tax=Collimonas antrihumi TaxID=1940615 RepID=UPI001B8C56BC
MTDVWSVSKRSEVMGRIRSQDNLSTEGRLIAIFRANKVSGWRRRQNLLGKPDFVFRECRVCVFVDGCFWHGCPKCYRRPSSNQSYWDQKVQRNAARDRFVSRELKKQGWQILRIWEHQLSEVARGRLLLRFRRYGLTR